MICTNPSILIVDKDVSARCGLADALMRARWPVVIATTVTSALDCLSLHPFNAVFIPVLPDQRAGVEAIQDIRRRQPQCVIVATSGGDAGLTGHEARRIARAVGADAMLSKPLPDAKFMKLVRDFLAKRRQRSLEGLDDAHPAQTACLTQAEPALRPPEMGSDRTGPSAKAVWLRSLSDDQLDGWLADQMQELSSKRA